QATAMVFNEPGELFEEKKIDLSSPEDGEVLVKISYSTICSSDLHTFSGRRISPSPSILGHEIIGTIEAIGDIPVTDFYGDILNIGDQVTWAVYAYDKNSKMSQKGIPQKSEGLYKYGHHKLSHTETLNGGFATHCILKSGTPIFRLPPGLAKPRSPPPRCGRCHAIAGW
ncbi:MAG: alcohol dehydrogenase, partial [Rubrivivax sp.]